MELLIYVVVFGVLARAFALLGGGYGRSGPSGLLSGLFNSPGLGWPEGVQEEDRERVWSWAPPAVVPDDADLIDVPTLGVEPAPVQRVS